MRTDLSAETKQSFQVVALLATILVVGIHYKSDIPDFSDPGMNTTNQLAQEFLFGGIARVAVPMFALAAGMFYFRSDDGSFTSYCTKLHQRMRTIAIPYLIISTIALATWLAFNRLQQREIDWTVADYLAKWLLHPPAEQLWFLRDLLVLIAIAPIIRIFCGHRFWQIPALLTLLVLWAANVQPFPIVAQWRLLHMETLFFFSLGCAAVTQPRWIEGIGRVSGMTVLFAIALWCMLVATRITIRADFDMWYVTNYGPADLMLHQASILVGCIALYMISFRARHPWLIRLSGASFFVYLVHEYPLRAVVRTISDRLIDHDTSSWVLTPLVLIGCFGVALLLNAYAPSVIGMITGGRTPSRATRIADPITRPATSPSS